MVEDYCQEDNKEVSANNVSNGCGRLVVSEVRLFLWEDLVSTGDMASLARFRGRLLMW